MKARNVILNQEIPVIIINTILGVGTINLPAALARSAGPDGIIAFIIATILVLVATVLIVCLVSRFPKQGIAHFSTDLLGAIPGFILNMLIALFFLFGNSMVLRIFGDTVKIFLLPRTPLEVIMISMLIATVLLARNGLQPIARSCQIILFLFPLPFFLLPFIAAVFDFGEFLPLFQTDLPAMASTTMKAMFSLAGIEVLLVLGSHVEIKKRFMRLNLYAVAISAFTILLLVGLAFGTLSVEQTAKLRDPVFEMIKYLPVPVLVIERADLFFFSVWIGASYSTILILLFTAGHHLAETFGLGDHKGFIIPAAIAVFFLARLPASDGDLARFNDYTVISWLILVLGIVPLLLLISYLRNKGQPLLKKNAKPNAR